MTKTNYQTLILNPERNAALPRLRIFQTPEKIWHIEAEASLPRTIFGHNAQLPNQSEVKDGLKIIGDYMRKKTGLYFEDEEAVVARVDYAKDFQLSETHVLQLIRKLSNQTLPRMDKLLFNNETLYFKAKSKNRQIRIYGKHREVISRKNFNTEEIDKSKGVLRIEYSLSNSVSIKNLIKKLSLLDRTTSSLLRENVSNRVISDLLNDLNFDLQPHNESNLETLLKIFPARRAMTLVGFLEMVSIRGESFYKDNSLGISKGAYYRDLRDLKKAKILDKA